MATVPTYGDSPRVPESAVRPVVATPAAFGAAAGRQNQALGDQLQQVGQTGANIMVQMQEQKNLERVFSAESDMRKAETDFHNEVRNRKGTNAEGLDQDAIKWWDAKGQELRQNLDNEPQQLAFDRIYQERRNASLNFVMQHQAVESRRAATEASAADELATIQNGIANPGAVDENVAALRRIIGARGKMNGSEQSVVDAEIADATTKMHVGVIKSLVDRYPGAARAYYKDHESQILPSERDKVLDSLRAGETKGFAQRKADEIMARYSDPGDQIEAARNASSDPDRRAALVSEVRAQQADTKRIQMERESQADDLARYLITDRENGIRSLNEMPNDTWDAMSAEGRVFVTNWFAKIAANGGDPFSKADDLGQVTGIEQAIERGDITDQKQLNVYHPFMTKETYGRLRTKLEKAKQVSPSAVLDVFENREGASRAKWIDDPDTVAKWDAFNRYVYNAVQDRVYSSNDIAAMADNFYMEIAVPWGLDTTVGEVITENPDLIERGTNTYKTLAGRTADEISVRRRLPRILQTLAAERIDINPANVGAAMLLEQYGKVINEQQINAVLQSASGR